MTDGLTFEFANALVKDFEPESFDVVYSRDCIIHIREKAALFERFFKWLKPGGKLMISGTLKNFIFLGSFLSKLNFIFFNLTS